MARPEAVAVLDIGKSNAKLALVGLFDRKVLDIRAMPNQTLRDGPYIHFDVDRLWNFILDGLTAFAMKAEVRVVSTTTHGACFAVVAGDGLALPVIDYEDTGPESLRAEYRVARGTFDELLSPDLPNGLNVGRQLFWLSRRFPEAFARADAILPYPQYWVWRLTGAKVSEVTSFGSHTDLWRPRTATFSTLAEREGWVRLFPPMVNAWDPVGPLRPDVIARTGLSPDCRVVGGIHDSNASLLPHILGRPQPFAVISTGTWMITFAAGGSLDHLNARRDCLAYVDACARPVPATMVMGGREFELLTAGATGNPAIADVADVVTGDVMALPSFVAGSGPFGRRKGSWTVDPGNLSSGKRLAAASLYSALIADTCLGLAGAAGPIIVEGPFSRNRIFLSTLAQLTGRPVIAPADPTGTTEGAAMLALGPEAHSPATDEAPVTPIDVDLSTYAQRWRERANA